jgi:hypothetical protein
MQTETLRGAEDYFIRVLRPNKEAFFGNASNFANTLNLATALYHFHEWLYASFKAQLEGELNTKFSGKGAFWQTVEAIDPRFGYIRDVANASKHVTIGEPGKPKPSTGMRHIANTHIITSGYGERGYGKGSYGAHRMWSLTIVGSKLASMSAPSRCSIIGKSCSPNLNDVVIA